MSDWIPTYGQPLGYVEISGKRIPVKTDATWFRALTTAFGRLGIDGKTVGAVDDKAGAANSTAIANAAALEAVIAQAIANAAILQAAVDSLVAAGAPGAGAIGPIDPGDSFPPVDPGTPLP